MQDPNPRTLRKLFLSWVTSGLMGSVRDKSLISPDSTIREEYRVMLLCLHHNDIDSPAEAWLRVLGYLQSCFFSLIILFDLLNIQI